MPGQAATLAPGDILVADISALDGTGGIFKVDPLTGQQSAVASNAINTGTDYFEDPTGVALDAAGQLLVSDYTPVDPNDGRLIRVDPATGQQTLVSDNTISTANLMRGPWSVAVEASGRVLVADFLSGNLIGVDPATGQQSVVSNNAVSTENLMGNPAGLAIEPSGQVLVADHSGSGGPVTGSVYRVNPVNGEQTAVSDNVINTGTDRFDSPNGVARESSGQVLVSDPFSPPGATNEDGAVIRVNPANGQQTLLSDNTISPPGFFNGNVYPIALEANGQILVGEESGTSPGSGGGEVIRISPATGQQTAVTDRTINTGIDVLFAPYGLLVVPQPSGPAPDQPTGMGKCRGRQATHTGTGGADRLTGTAGPDVFAALDGNDVIRGLKGNDVACGGGGRDRIKGGPGRDLLAGGAGRDVLIGGPGRDRLLGGAGTDRTRQ